MSFRKNLAAPSPTPSNSSTNGAKRKRPDDGARPVVYSQPQETSSGEHLYTVLGYATTYLKEKREWTMLKDILSYLNLKPDYPVDRLIQVFQAASPHNRIEYDRKTDLYRYKPKLDIRNAAQLRGWLQNQQSAAGISVKDLKDGWPEAQEEINKLEEKKEILVSRNKKDSAPKTVWLNDPTLVNPMDVEFRDDWHRIQLPANPEELRNKLTAAGLKPASAPRKAPNAQAKEKKRKTTRRNGKQTNTHMLHILKDYPVNK
jgi:transcription initiation factor TFIIE subunit beta